MLSIAQRRDCLALWTGVLISTLPLASQAEDAVDLPPAELATVESRAPAQPATEARSDYFSPAPSATATGLSQRAQETPQPVQVLTRSLLNDQDAQTMGEMVTLSAGLVLARGQLYARGFALSQWMLDGMAVNFDKNFDLGQNLALYDRVEVVQGASGLMSGMGNPSAALNLVRKLPTSRPRLELQLRAGSWGQHEAMLDAAGPLNTAGTLRGRVVVDAENQHSFQDQVAHRKRSYYGVIEADIAPQTTVRLGASQQRNQHRDSLSAIPTAPEGSDLRLPRSTYLGYDWEYVDQRTSTAFAQLEHEWSSGWQLRADLLKLRSDQEYLGTYLAGGDPTALRQSLGQYAFRHEQTSYALALRGPWHLAGRTHQLAIGLSYRHSDATGDGWTVPNWISDLNAYAPAGAGVPSPALSPLPIARYQYHQTLAPTQTGAWLATQLQLHPRLQLTLGGRWDRYRHQGEVQDNLFLPGQRTDQDTLQHFSHYAGLVWAAHAQHRLYLQTSDIFQPRTERDTSGQVLPASTGRTIGAGWQGQYLEQRLHAGVHLFQATQQHVPVQEYQQLTCASYPGIVCFRSSEQVRSRGLTAQLQGQLTSSWQLSASYTYLHSKYHQDGLVQGQRPEPLLPRHSWQLSTVYRLPNSPWRVGASLYGQSAVYSAGQDVLTGQQPYRIQQPAYMLVGLMVARQFGPQWQLQLNVRNLLDRRYYESIEAPLYTSYGAPRSWQATLRYQF